MCNVYTVAPLYSVCDVMHSADFVVYHYIYCSFVVGDPRGVRCCYGYGDSFLQVFHIDTCDL